MEDYKNFLMKMGELKYYMIKFDKFGVKKSNIYILDCAIGWDN